MEHMTSDRRMGARMKTWHGCYNSSWNGFITPESFAHPAKFARGLIERIFDHCLERGYLKRGDRVGDCFGGIGTGGIIAAYRGLRWAGCELEPRFVAMARANFELHESRLDRLSTTYPIIFQGDSRRFDEIVGGVGAIVSSPPYAEAIEKRGGHGDKPGFNQGHTQGKYSCGDGYGFSPGQIGALKSGTLQAVVSSPPWQESLDRGTVNRDERRAAARAAGISNAEHVSPIDMERIGKRSQPDYGATAGQIGQERGETYWQAVSQVYAACYRAIKPGGWIVLVVKDYVSKGKRVPLCDDTARLLEYVGFTVQERVHAMLTEETRHADLFHGETVSKKERKSFFRRLAEKNGSPPIDYEQVLFAQKPL